MTVFYSLFPDFSNSRHCSHHCPCPPARDLGSHVSDLVSLSRLPPFPEGIFLVFKLVSPCPARIESVGLVNWGNKESDRDLHIN